MTSVQHYPRCPSNSNKTGKTNERGKDCTRNSIVMDNYVFIKRIQ